MLTPPRHSDPLVDMFLAILLLIPLAYRTTGLTLKLTKHSFRTPFAPHRWGLRQRNGLPLDTMSSNGATYTVDIEVGGVILAVIADTGSVQSWIASPDCPTCLSAGMTTTNTPLPNDCVGYFIPFVLGRVEGCFVNASISIGGIDLPDVDLLGVNKIDEIFGDASHFMSGILSLGISDAGIDDTPPWVNPSIVDQLYTSGKIKKPVAGFYLARYGEGESEMILGDVTASSHVDMSKHVSLPRQGVEHGHYAVTLDSLSIGEKRIASEQTVIIDTGTTYIYVPPSVYGALLTALTNENGSYYTYTDLSLQDVPVLRCDGFDAVVTLTFGGVKFDVDPIDFLGREIASGSGWCLARVTKSDREGFWLIGDVFLHNVYSVFDVQSGVVSFYGLHS